VAEVLDPEPTGLRGSRRFNWVLRRWRRRIFDGGRLGIGWLRLGLSWSWIGHRGMYPQSAPDQNPIAPVAVRKKLAATHGRNLDSNVLLPSNLVWVW